MLQAKIGRVKTAVAPKSASVRLWFFIYRILLFPAPFAGGDYLLFVKRDYFLSNMGRIPLGTGTRRLAARGLPFSGFARKMAGKSSGLSRPGIVAIAPDWSSELHSIQLLVRGRTYYVRKFSRCGSNLHVRCS